MKFSDVRIAAQMVSAFREPFLQLGVQASDVMEIFYKALQQSQKLSLNDLLTSGGTSYGHLKLTINTFSGMGRVDITPGALIVNVRDIHHDRNGSFSDVAREHVELCEQALLKAINDVEISERAFRTSLWLACEGGAPAVEAFLGEKGNAALKLDQGTYAALKKEFTLQVNALDVARATRIGFGLQRSTGEGDLFVQFDHVNYGSPSVTLTIREQFEEAERELEKLMLHIGLESKRDDDERA